jgi:hypothetical protein
VQYQIGQPAEKRLPLSHLEIVHGRLKLDVVCSEHNERERTMHRPLARSI